jgi:hypothetical protein
MNDDCYLDDLENYLLRAEVLEVADPQFAGAHGQKVRLLLEGGVLVLAKPEAGIGEGSRVVRREVAAWIFARELGLADMVACTILRPDVPALDGTRGPASVQILWPVPSVPDHAGPFPEEDRWRAAIFDAVIAHSDRGHNWLGLPDANGEYRLKLVDHGYAFEFGGQPFQSSFYNDLQGQPLPEQYVPALRNCGHSPQQGRHLRELFDGEDDKLQNALDRATHLVEGGVLAL